jgi:hypothetical protein
MKNQGNTTPTKDHNSLVTESKETKLHEMPNKEFKRIVFKSSMRSKRLEINH